MLPEKDIEEVVAKLLGKLAAGRNCRRVKTATQRDVVVTPRVQAATAPNETRPGRHPRKNKQNKKGSFYSLIGRRRRDRMD